MFNVVTTVAGSSGAGKTSSMRNLDNSAILYNVEQKELPFPKKQNQIADKRITHPVEMMLHLPKVMIRPDITTICLDSFSHTVNYFKFKTQYEDEKKGFDIYRGYNDMIFAMFELFKKMMNKYVFVLAHAEEFDEPNGKKSYIQVDGNVYKKTVEQFAVVSFHATKIKVTDEHGRPKAKHILEYESFDAATKAPMLMFDGDVDNDLSLVVNRYREFWNHPTKEQMICKYTDESFTSELLRRMEEMKLFYKGPLNIDPKRVDAAFQEAYDSIPAIMSKIVLPTIKRLEGGLTNVHPTAVVPEAVAPVVSAPVIQPMAQAQPAQVDPKQVAPPIQPVPVAVAPVVVTPLSQPVVQQNYSGIALPTPGMSISAIDELANSI